VTALAAGCALCAVCGSEAIRAASESLSPEPAARAPRLTKRFALVLDGQLMGLLEGVSGGGVKADVIEQRTEPGGLLRKRLGRPHPQEISLQVGLAMSPTFYRWIAQTWEDAGSRPDESSTRRLAARPASSPGASSAARTGAILELDESGIVRTRREFVDARITEVTVPALDVAEKKPGALTVKILPESVRFVKGDAARREGETIRLETRTWLPCHFRVTLDGLEE